MKGSKILIIGGLVVAGVIVYEIYKHYHSSKDSYQVSTPDADNTVPKQNNTLPVDSSAKPASDIYETKGTVVTSVKERHYEAARVMEESLNTIFRENDEETIVSENIDTLSKTSSDLNGLLK